MHGSRARRAHRRSWIRRSRGFKQTVLPRAESQPGFAGALELVDRETGSWLTVTLWETVEARDASEEMARSLSSEGESTFDAEIVGVERYEVTTRTL